VRLRSLHSAAEAMRGRLVVSGPAGPEPTVRGVAVDSRKAGPGDLFFALAGERVDGHRFVEDAASRGAVAAVVRADRAPAGPGPSLIQVSDPGEALQDLARDERVGMAATVIGVTGSTGKTCTKDFIAAVLGSRLRVVRSPASFNNEVGLPLTMLSAADDTEVLVCEMGARGPGQIRLLCDIARPRLGVVTNVGVAHMEVFGSPDALRAAKAELPEALPDDGVAVLNADDPVVRGYAARTRARVVLFGTKPEASVRAERIGLETGDAAATFDLVTPDGRARVKLAVPGEHMVPNAVAAAAVGWALGISPAEAAAALGRAEVSSGRMETFETPDGLRVVNDTYNANPTSMAAALRAARWMAGSGRCIAVLGPMAELGPLSAGEHARVGELVARLGIYGLVVVGGDGDRGDVDRGVAHLIAVEAEREGVEPDRIVECRDVEEAVAAVRSLASPGDVVLVKASRVARLERVVERLRAPVRAVNGAAS
jgi:UDP-N-acetylmuramoyl-tripeptide--D-alanyl-D-alanine ligase